MEPIEKFYKFDKNNDLILENYKYIIGVYFVKKKTNSSKTTLIVKSIVKNI